MRNTVCFFKMFYYKQDKFTKLSLIGIFFQLIFHFRNSSDWNVKIVKSLQSGKEEKKGAVVLSCFVSSENSQNSLTHNATQRKHSLASHQIQISLRFADSDLRLISASDSFSSQIGSDLSFSPYTIIVNHEPVLFRNAFEVSNSILLFFASSRIGSTSSAQTRAHAHARTHFRIMYNAFECLLFFVLIL